MGLLFWIGVVLFLVVSVFAIYYFYPERELPLGTQIDRLVVLKHQRRMQAYSGDTLVKTYRVSLGKDPIGHKQREGDNKTPEGIYYINDRNPNSAYHKNLGVSYPNDEDSRGASARGDAPGGDIKIHGLRNGTGYMGKLHRWKDWTAGCIAVTDQEIDELYDAVAQNAVIDIKP